MKGKSTTKKKIKSSSKKQYGEFRIRGLSPVIHDGLNNIADNLAMTTNDFAKQELRKIHDSYPEHMRKPVKED